MRIEKFTNLYRDVTKEGTKIPQEKYCLTGQFPIVDQGQRVIAGWWNDDAGIFKNVPAIIFGDHTRAIKYMEQPFFIGADGVKILRPTNIKDNPKYLYYALQAAKIPNLGYSRHFKVVKELQICIYSRDEQNEIVRVLEKIDYLIEQRHAETTYLDQLVKSRFIELFGDPISNPLGWPVKRLDDISVLITNGNTPKGGSDNYVSEGIVFLRSQNVWRNKIDLDDVAYIDAATHADMAKSSIHDKDILITKTGRINTENSSLGRAALFRGADNSANINGHVYLVRLDGTTVPEYVVAILTGEPYRRYIRKVCVGGIDKRQINPDQVEDFPIILPPMKMQEQFAAFVEQTDKSKYYSSLSFRYCQAAANTYRQEWMTCRTSDF